MSGWYKISLIRIANTNRSEALRRRGIGQDIISYIESLDEDRAKYITNAVFQRPGISLHELSNLSQGFPNPNQDVYTDFEKQLTTKFLPEQWQRWGLINLKKQRMKGKGGIDQYPHSEQDYANHLNEIVDWAKSNKIDLKPLDYTFALNKARDWAKEGDVIVYGPKWKNKAFNGYTIRKLINDAAFCREGKENANCVGQHFTRDSAYDIYSLRSPQNKPVITLRTKKDSNNIVESKSFANAQVNEKNTALMLREWFNSLSNPTFDETGYGDYNSDFPVKNFKQKIKSKFRQIKPEEMQGFIEDRLQGIHGKEKINKTTEIGSSGVPIKKETQINQNVNKAAPTVALHNEARRLYVEMLREAYQKESKNPDDFYHWLDSAVNSYVSTIVRHDFMKIAQMHKLLEKSNDKMVDKYSRFATMQYSLVCPFIYQLVKNYIDKHPEPMKYAPSRTEHASYNEYAKNLNNHLNYEGYSDAPVYPSKEMISYEFEVAIANALSRELKDTNYSQVVNNFIESGEFDENDNTKNWRELKNKWDANYNRGKFKF